jgi:hypothetical protein
MCSVKSPRISSITTEPLNRMMTTDDYVDDDDQSVIRSSYYEKSSDNKERLRIQPVQLFHCTRSVNVMCSVECR